LIFVDHLFRVAFIKIIFRTLLVVVFLINVHRKTFQLTLGKKLLLILAEPVSYLTLEN